MVENPQEIIDYGVFKGFNIFVFLIVVFQAINGLVSLSNSLVLSAPLDNFVTGVPREWRWLSNIVTIFIKAS
jgi:hypothetical protein